MNTVALVSNPPSNQRTAGIRSLPAYPGTYAERKPGTGRRHEIRRLTGCGASLVLMTTNDDWLVEETATDELGIGA